MTKRTVWVLMLASLATLLVSLISGGCSKDPQKAKQAYLRSGIHYLEKHNYQEAIIQFQNALKADPNFGEAFYQIAQADLGNHDWQGAYGNLLQVIHLDPGRADAHITLGNLYITGRDYQKAEDEATTVLQKDPGNASAYDLLAVSLAARQRHEEAVKAYRKVIELRPKEADPYINLGLSEVALNRQDDAEKHMLQAIQLNPHAAGAYSNLANLYRLQRQLPRGQQILEQGVSNNPDDKDLYFTWADFLYSQQKKEEADAALKKARDRQPKSGAIAMAIGDFYVGRHEVEKALAEYRRGIKIDAKNFEIRDHLVECLLDAGRTGEAETANSEIIRQRPKDVRAGIAGGRILLASGKSSDAVEQLRTVVTKAQDSPQAHYYLALAYIQNQNLQQAKSELQEALRLSPDMFTAQQTLSKVQLQLGEIKEAQSVVEKITKEHPSDIGTKVLMAGILLDQGAPAKARDQLLLARELAPGDPVISSDIGQTYMAERKITEAERELENALKQNPRFTPALEQLANIAVATNQAGKGIERVSQYIAKYPDDAAAHVILGKLRMAQKQYGPAQDEFQRALALDPKLVPAYLQMGNLYQQKGDIVPAIQTFEKCLTLAPKLAVVHAILGNLYLKQKNEEMAGKHYEQALALDPDLPSVANNLAWMYANEGKNLDVALGLAQKAKQLQPDSPATTDTLAWIQYKKGLYAGAIPLLQECVTTSPESPTYHYHLGMALLASGDTKRANQELQTALRLNLAGDDATQARLRLKQN